MDFQSIKVINIDQTNLKDVNPSLYEKYAPAKVENDLTNAFKFRPLDELIKKQTWVCPIRTKLHDRAFFSPLDKVIVVPAKEQFNNQQIWQIPKKEIPERQISLKIGLEIDIQLNFLEHGN